jgi:hypothetical protein
LTKRIRQDFSNLERRVLAVKALPDGTIAIVEFNDSEDPDEIKIASVSRFQLIRRIGK